MGLKLDDVLIKICGVEAGDHTYEEAVAEIDQKEDNFDMTIER